MIPPTRLVLGSPFWCIEWHEWLSSTMDRATDLAKVGAPSGSVVVADFQSAGRGTHGRKWHAAPGTCLMFTILVRPDLAPEMLEPLPIEVASSVALALNDYTGLAIGISPPNDLTIRSEKVSGTLCTSRIVGTSVEWVLCGIGINTNMRQDELPLPGLTSLAIETGGAHFEHGQLLEAVLERLRWIRDGECASCAGYADKPILSSKVE